MYGRELILQDYENFKLKKSKKYLNPCFSKYALRPYSRTSLEFNLYTAAH